jgi:hypothetical protein
VARRAAKDPARNASVTASAISVRMR